MNTRERFVQACDCPAPAPVDTRAPFVRGGVCEGVLDGKRQAYVTRTTETFPPRCRTCGAAWKLVDVAVPDPDYALPLPSALPRTDPRPPPPPPTPTVCIECMTVHCRHGSPGNRNRA